MKENGICASYNGLATGARVLNMKLVNTGIPVVDLFPAIEILVGQFPTMYKKCMLVYFHVQLFVGPFPAFSNLGPFPTLVVGPSHGSPFPWLQGSQGNKEVGQRQRAQNH